jgi:hypothetical protein
MSRFLRRDRRALTASDPVDIPEDPVVRQYRFLLRTAPSDALEAAHAESLPKLTDADRVAVLGAVQSGLVAGQRLTPEAVHKIAHLLVRGEHRDPGAFLRACPPASLQALARAAIHSEAVFGLFGGYPSWDGAEPEPVDDSKWRDAGFNPDSGRWNLDREPSRDNSGIVSGAGGGFGGDGGGGGG